MWSNGWTQAVAFCSMAPCAGFREIPRGFWGPEITLCKSTAETRWNDEENILKKSTERSSYGRILMTRQSGFWERALPNDTVQPSWAVAAVNRWSARDQTCLSSFPQAVFVPSKRWLGNVTNFFDIGWSTNTQNSAKAAKNHNNQAPRLSG